MTIGASAIVSCERRTQVPADSVPPSQTVSSDAGWVPELGPVLAVPGDSENTAIVLAPAMPSGELPATLFRTAGESTAGARISLAESDTLVCDDARIARLSGPTVSGWTVALSPGVTALRLDSIENLAAGDSASLAANVARLASSAPDSEKRFSGLPFAVLAAYRFQVDGSTIVVGRAARRIPQEATPFEERTLVVGERAASAPFALKHSMRSAGAEEIVEHHALLAVLRAGDKHFLVIESARDNGTRYQVLERTSAGIWRLRWSRQLDC